MRFEPFTGEIVKVTGCFGVLRFRESEQCNLIQRKWSTEFEGRYNHMEMAGVTEVNHRVVTTHIAER